MIGFHQVARTKSVGFSGSRNGMTTEQRAQLKRLLLGTDVFHHGDCVGADAEAHAIAHEMGIAIVLHPPRNGDLRAFCTGAAVICTPYNYLTRNHHIVDQSDRLIACPNSPQATASPHSGTWATIRYGWNQTKPVSIIYPDGSIQDV